jgi:hypothetical protein
MSTPANEGLSELVGALTTDAPIWPNKWGQDVAFVGFYIDGCKRRIESLKAENERMRLQLVAISHILKEGAPPEFTADGTGQKSELG